MLAVRIIPCLDVKDGRVVKGVSFVNLRDAGDPVENAKVYDGEGADELTFLDITASHENRDIILDVVKKTAEEVLVIGVGNSWNEIKNRMNSLFHRQKSLPAAQSTSSGHQNNDGRRPPVISST